MGEAKRRSEMNGGEALPMVDSPPTAPSSAGPSRKIMIAIPAYGGKLDNATVVCCANASAEVSSLGWQTVMCVRAGDSILPRCRDVLVSQFYYSDCTDMLFLDADISCEPGAFLRLMSHPVEMVGGVYRGRGDPPAYCVCGIKPGEINVNYPAGLGEVRGLGTGFLRITRTAVERIIRYLPKNRWYHDEFTAKGLKIHHFFDFVFDFEQDPGMRLRSEDYAFCDLFRAAGGKLYADVELKLHHAGPHTWTGHFGEYLREQAKHRPAKETGVMAPEGIAPGLSLVDAVEGMIRE